MRLIFLCYLQNHTLIYHKPWVCKRSRVYHNNIQKIRSLVCRMMRCYCHGMSLISINQTDYCAIKRKAVVILKLNSLEWRKLIFCSSLLACICLDKKSFPWVLFRAGYVRPFVENFYSSCSYCFWFGPSMYLKLFYLLQFWLQTLIKILPVAKWTGLGSRSCWLAVPLVLLRYVLNKNETGRCLTLESDPNQVSNWST